MPYTAIALIHKYHSHDDGMMMSALTPVDRSSIWCCSMGMHMSDACGLWNESCAQGERTEHTWVQKYAQLYN